MAGIATRRCELAGAAATATDRGLRLDRVAFRDAIGRLALRVEELPTAVIDSDPDRLLCETSSLALHAQDCLDGAEPTEIRRAPIEPALFPWEEESPRARVAECVDWSTFRRQSIDDVRRLAHDARGDLVNVGVLRRLARVTGLMAVSIECDSHPAAAVFTRHVHLGYGQLLEGRERRSMSDLLDDAHPTPSCLLLRCLLVVDNLSSTADVGTLASARERFLESGACLLRGWEGLAVTGYLDPPSPELTDVAKAASRLVALIDVMSVDDCDEVSLDAAGRATGALVHAVLDQTWDLARGGHAQVQNEVIGHQFALALRNVLAAIAWIDVRERSGPRVQVDT